MGQRGTSRRAPRSAVVSAAIALALVVAGVPSGAAASPPPGGVERQTAPPPDQLFLRAAYEDLAGREPTATEIGAGLAALGSGRSRTQVASTLTHGIDHAGEVVDRLYVRILDRPSEAAGRAFWVARLGSGIRVATLASELYASPEYLTHAGGTPGGYVDAVYRDLLGRTADASGRAYWVGRVAAGGSRHVLARLLYLSRESNGLRIVLAYWDLLRRPPEPDARAYWADRLVQTDDLDVEALLAGSDEYITRAQDPDALRQTRLTAGRGYSYDAEVSADGRFVVFSSTGSDLIPGTDHAGNGIFLIDRVTGRIRPVAVGNGTSQRPDISADGSTIVFESGATNLVPGDTDFSTDVFQVATAGGPIRRLTSGNGHSRSPRVNGDGSVVVFSSEASDVVADDDAGFEDVFIRTARAGLPVTVERIGGQGASTLPDVSADGSAMSFLSQADDLVGAEVDGDLGTYWARLPRSAGGEVLQIGEADLDGGIAQPPGLSADGQVVGDPLGGTVATLPSSGIEHHPVGDGLVIGVAVSDDGSSAAATGLTVVGSAVANGRYHSPLSAPGVPAGPYGSLTADGHQVVTDTRVFPAVNSSHLVVFDFS